MSTQHTSGVLKMSHVTTWLRANPLDRLQYLRMDLRAQRIHSQRKCWDVSASPGQCSQSCLLKLTLLAKWAVACQKPCQALAIRCDGVECRVINNHPKCRFINITISSINIRGKIKICFVRVNIDFLYNGDKCKLKFEQTNLEHPRPFRESQNLL